jgi:hypothetical protein
MKGNSDPVRVTVEGTERLLADLQATSADENDSGAPDTAGHLSDDELMEYGLGVVTAEGKRRVEEHVAQCDDCSLEVGLMADSAAEWAGEEGRRRLEALARSVLEPPETAALVQDLRSRSGDSPIAAAALVGLHGDALASPEILAALAAMLSSHDSEFLEAAAATAGRIGAAAPHLLRDRLRELTAAPSEGISAGSFREAALEACRRIGPFEAVVTLLADVAPLRLAARTDRLERGRAADGRFRWTIATGDAGCLVITLAVDGIEYEGSRLSLRAGPWHAVAVLERVAPAQVGAQIVLTRQERAAISSGTPLVSEVLHDL